MCEIWHRFFKASSTTTESVFSHLVSSHSFAYSGKWSQFIFQSRIWQKKNTQMVLNLGLLLIIYKYASIDNDSYFFVSET